MNGSEILTLRLQDDNDAGAETVKEYLITLLHEVWNKGESFSGKRPFGNSGWECDLYWPLEQANIPREEWDDAIFDAIDAL